MRWTQGSWMLYYLPLAWLLIVSSRLALGWSAEIATRVGFLSELVRLRLETAQALQAAEASQRRLVAANDKERHRLERDLHDGAQQRLVTLGQRPHSGSC